MSSSALNLHGVLAQQFGHDTFRPGQIQVIEQILKGQSSAAVFPTGSGKSLCYQLPALLLPGLSLIVSPLLALMKDQIDSLLAKGIRAARLDSTLTHDEYQQTMRDVRNGVIKILYVAPERFMNERFRASMAGINISLFAVDEAHCISEWGHNFRPDYLKLPLYAKAFGAKVILALTATATPAVLLDIQRAFDVKPECAVVTGFYRPNFTLLSQPVERDSRDAALLDELRSNPPGSTIVYVTQQKTAETVANMLNDHGLEAKAYHAGMPPDERVETQNWFIASDSGIVVATIAFGMGIDKADIRYVYHYNLPKSLENYSQEIGRAGRDGKPARCKVFACPDDLNALENFVYGDKASPRALDALMARIFREARLDVSLLELSTQLDIRSIVLATVMTNLELKGYLKAETPYYQSYEFKHLRPWAEVLAEVPEDRHSFLNSLLEHADKRILWSKIDVEASARAMGEARDRVVTALGWLAEKGFIELKVAGIRNAYQILQQPDSTERLAKECFADMDRRESKELSRLRDILQWTVLDSCQAQYLGAYFGELRAEPCGHCSYCLGERDRRLPPRTRTSPEVLEQALARVEDLRAEARGKTIDAYTMARFLCGISSPALMRSKLSSKHPSFGVLTETPFEIVLTHLNERGLA